VARTGLLQALMRTRDQRSKQLLRTGVPVRSAHVVTRRLCGGEAERARQCVQVAAASNVTAEASSKKRRGAAC